MLVGAAEDKTVAIAGPLSMKATFTPHDTRLNQAYFGNLRNPHNSWQELTISSFLGFSYQIYDDVRHQAANLTTEAATTRMIAVYHCCGAGSDLPIAGCNTNEVAQLFILRLLFSIMRIEAQLLMYSITSCGSLLHTSRHGESGE